jgi:hypothetical protein
MKNIRESVIEFFKSEDSKRNMKEMIKPIGEIVYNEIYIFIWLICFYHIFFIFIVLANLFLLLKLIGMNNKIYME